MRVVVGTSFVAAALGDGLCPHHHERLAHGAHSARRFRLDRIFAFWIIRAAPKYAESPLALDDLAFFARGTLYPA